MAARSKYFTTEEVVTLYAEGNPLNNDTRTLEMTFTKYQGVTIEDSNNERQEMPNYDGSHSSKVSSTDDSLSDNLCTIQEEESNLSKRQSGSAQSLPKDADRNELSTVQVDTNPWESSETSDSSLEESSTDRSTY